MPAFALDLENLPLHGGEVTMGKPPKSQWDFGELFQSEPARKILSVAELTTQIRRLLEERVGKVWVSGEITNLRVQSSGHIYFTLKDASAQLNCVLFRGEYQVDRAALRDGSKVVLRGDLTVYEPRGQYQLRVTQLELEGIGALQAAFERLKQKLRAEGLFATERKRPLPRYPQRIGLVTSPTGAAIRDILHVAHRRNPSLQILLAPCRVQGEGAAAEIAEAVRTLNEFNRRILSELDQTSPTHEDERPSAGDRQMPLDLILLSRGGGSLEDLWSFNEELVARAIFESALPVVSAVGHEIDFTISDFVADVRAATPSAAAEIITEGVLRSCEFLTGAKERIRQLTWQKLEDKAQDALQIRQRLARAHPRRRIGDIFQELDDFQNALGRAAQQALRHKQEVSARLSSRLMLSRPGQVLKQRRERIQTQHQQLRTQVRHRFRELKNRLASMESQLGLLGPAQVLARGYSITLKASDGSILRSATEISPGETMKTVLKHGEVLSRVEHLVSESRQENANPRNDPGVC
jgi:exodeoxyribonuclease VII large subunit